MRLMWQILGMLTAAYAGLAGLLYFSQSSMVYYPEIGREMMSTPRQVGLDYEDVKLVTADGVALHGWFVPSVESRGTVLFLHGNAGNISHRLDFLQMFHRLGYSTLIIDYRGYGNNAGKPSEQGTYQDAEAAWRHRATGDRPRFFLFIKQYPRFRLLYSGWPPRFSGSRATP